MLMTHSSLHVQYMARSVPIDEMTRRCAYTRQASEGCAKREGQLARLLISAGLLSTVKPLTRYSPPVSTHVFVIRAGRDALERLDSWFGLQDGFIPPKNIFLHQLLDMELHPRAIARHFQS